MESSIKLIAGLGNPGLEYFETRHNTGADCVTLLAQKYSIELRENNKYFGLYGKINIANQDIHIVVPTTYMNLSGKSISALANFYKIKPEEILVVHDELDLLPGTMKLKFGGGHGGHNGLKDIISKLGNNSNFYRLRIGIGKPLTREQVIGYVLGKAPMKERELVLDVFQEAIVGIESIIKNGSEKAMNKINSFKANKGV